MNPTNLVEMIKAIAKERSNQAPLTHHSRRYTEKPLKAGVKPSTLAQRNRYEPKGKNLAEEGDEINLGKTATGNNVTVTFNPTNASLVTPPAGPKPKT